MISIVVAVGNNNEIGKNNQLIWHLPADLKHFKNVTMGKHIIMGRKTFESIGKALPGRISIVITRQKDYKAEGCVVVNSLESAYKQIPDGKEACVIGGAEIFKQCLPFTDLLYLTRIHENFDADTFFPAIDMNQWTIEEEHHFSPDEKNLFKYTFFTLKKKK